MKMIYIEPDEEIISIIDRIDRISDQRISLAIPKNAQLWQSSINLKLLKREIDELNKKVILIIPNDLDSEMAERVGFRVRKVTDIRTETELIGREDTPIDSARENTDDEIEEEAEEEFEDEVEEVPEEGTEEETEMETAAESEEESIEDEDLSEEAPAEEESAEIEEEGEEAGSKKDNMIETLVNELESDPTDEFRDAFKDSISKDKKIILSNYRKKSHGRKITNLFAKKSPSRRLKRKVVRRRPAARGTKLTRLLRPRFTFKKASSEPSSVWGKVFVCFIALAVILVCLVAYFVLPTTEVMVYPQVEIINLDLSIWGSKDISELDIDSNKIPIQEIAVEKSISKEFETSGEKQLNEKARGIITIYNEYSSSPQILVATTRFQSPSGKIFRIPRNIVVPGAKVEDGKIIASTLDVEVVADQPGSDYNIGPTDFVIPGFKGSPKYAGFYAKSSERMTGGSVGKVKIALAKDLTKAQDDLSSELASSAKLALQKQIPEGFQLIEDGVKEEIVDADFSVEENEEADSFILDMTMKVRAMVFDREDLRRIIDLNLLAEISEDKKLVSETQEFDWDKVLVDWDEGEASMSLFAQESVAGDIDIESLKKDLAGKNEVEVRKYFAGRQDIIKASFSFWPFWVKKIPYKESRIKITPVYSE